MRKILLYTIICILSSFAASAQCLNAPNGLYPSATFVPNCTGTSQTITTAGWAGEYSNVSVTAGSTYTFTSSISTDYITIANDAGTTALANGTTPLTWTSTVTGTVRFFTHESSACGDNTTSRTRAVSCTNSSCSGAPSIGTLSATAATVCYGSPLTLTLTGASTGLAGLNIIWEVADIGGTTWTNVNGPNATTYVVNAVKSFQYRATITCSNSGLSATSNIVSVNVTNIPTYATFPYSQSFESWVNGCSTTDRPDASWGNSPATGNNSWRRNDQGASAAWTGITFGMYTPAASQGTFSARFHSYDAPSGSQGIMDLFIDLSNPAPTKFVRFDYINTSGSDVLAVFVSTNGGTTFTQVGTNLGIQATWATKEFAINSTSATTVIRLRATGDFGVTDIGVDNFTVAVGCSGTPVGGTATATATSVCYGASTTLGITGASNEAGISTQWQSSPDGITWTNITGATASSYTFNVVFPGQYRALLTCSNGSGTATSTPVSIAVTSMPTYATFPYTQSFESWVNGCSTTDRPDASWGSIPASGNNSWRRNDQGASGAWTAITNGAYTPTSTQGSFSARFHSYDAPSGSQGILDLFINMSNPAPTKFLKFDHINTSGTDVLAVFISTNGGLTFTQLGTNYGVAATWTSREIPITSNSATTVIRFRATGDFGVTDIGIDNLSVVVGCSGTPVGGTTVATPASVCYGSNAVLSITGASTEAGISYQWQSSPDGTTWTNITGATGTTYNFTALAALQYRAVLTCSNGSATANSTPVTMAVTALPTYAAFPYTQGFESWVNGCSTTDRPDASWGNIPPSGNNSFRRNDQGASGAWTNITIGMYSPASSQGTYSARFHSYDAPFASQGILDLFIDLSTSTASKYLKFDYINTSGTDVLAVLVSTNGGLTFTQVGTNLGVSATWSTREFLINSNSATTVIRLRATGDFGVTDIGIDALSVAPGCSGTPVTGTTVATPASVCYGASTVLSLTGATTDAGITYQWQSSPDGTTWTNISGATANSYSASVTAPWQYRATLTCANGGTASSVPVTLTVTAMPTYATIPYFQGFESWINGCSTTDRPDASWGTIPSVSDSAWRRNDQGASANWNGPTLGAYTPASSEGTYSARFHSYNTSSSRKGIMDLFVNLSTSIGPKLLKFDYINTSGSDSLVILLSENGGQSFVRLDSLRTRAAWSTKQITINSNSATAVIRFRATSDFGVTDIGLDNLFILVPCSGTPTAGTVSAAGGNNFVCLGNSTTLSLSGQSLGTGLTFQWESSTDNISWTPVASATGLTLNVTPAVNTYYRVVVTCTNGNAFANTAGLLISVNNPQLVTTTPATRCGPGTVSLGATGTAGAGFNWYTSATGGAPVGTGASFTTPIINNTTTYYVAAAQGGGSSTIGLSPTATNCGTVSSSTATDWPLRFNTTSPVIINSAYVIPVAAGTFTVALRNSLSATNIQTASFTFTAAQVGIPQQINLGWNITTSGSYQLTNTTGGVYRVTTFTCAYPYTSAFGGFKIVGSSTSSTSATNTNTYNSFFSVNVSEGCESPRQAVVATVTAAPAFDVTDSITICNNATQALSVTSTLSSFDNYTWTPSANLFTNSGATTAYTGGNASTVYIKTATAGTYTYVVNALNNTSGCTGIDSVKVTVLPGGITVAATPSQICVSGQSALSLSPANGYTGAQFQWQSSTDGTNYTNIAGATSQNYNTPVISTTTYYRVLVKDKAGATCQQPSVMISVNSPSVLTTTPAALCGPGTMTLGATGSAGTVLNWYADANGGSPLGTGTSYTTGNLTATDTFYVSATAGGSIQSVGPISPNAFPNKQTSASFIQGLLFDVLGTSTTIQSVDIFPTSPVGTNFQIVIKQGSGSGPVIATYQGTTTVSGTVAAPVAQTVPVNFTLPAGFDYVMTFNNGTLQAPLSGTAVYPNALRNNPATGVAFPYAIANELSITSSTNVNTWNYFYNWRVGTGCESPRVAVIAQVSSNTSITQQPVAQSVCSGANISLSVSAVGANLTYQWKKDGVNVAGATSNTLQITGATSANAGVYTVVITGLCGTVTSTPVTVAVSPTNGWVGVTNTDWNTASNWCGGIPTPTSDVVIPSGTPFSPVINSLASVRNLTISSGASLTLMNNGFLNLYGNYSNSGTFNATTGYIAFKGTTNQSIAAMTVGNVIMNGTGGVTLAGNLTAVNNLILENGNISLGANTLTYTGSANGSVASHIITGSTGAVIANNVTTTAVIVPVGPDAASYNPVTITNGQGRNYTVKVATGLNPAIPQPGVAVNRTWTITPSTAVSSPVDITFQYADSHMNNPGSPTAMMQVGAHNGTAWTVVSPASGLVPVGAATDRRVTLSTTTFGPMVVTNIGGINIPTALPSVDPDITGAVLMPNLVRSTTVLRVKTTRATRIDWLVVDMQGRVMMNFYRQVPAGQTDINLDLSRFAQGQYQVVGFTQKGKLPVLKLVKM